MQTLSPQCYVWYNEMREGSPVTETKKPRRETHSMTIEPAIWEALEKYARSEDRSTSNVANLLLREGLEARGLLRKDSK